MLNKYFYIETVSFIPADDLINVFRRKMKYAAMKINEATNICDYEYIVVQYWCCSIIITRFNIIKKSV